MKESFRNWALTTSAIGLMVDWLRLVSLISSRIVSAPSTLCLYHPSLVGGKSELRQHAFHSYHDDVKKWNFGKLGAMREAALAAEGGYGYYYMGKCASKWSLHPINLPLGFFIPSCPKMRYKGDYSLQELLGERFLLDRELWREINSLPSDPESYTWEPLDDELKRRLDTTKYVSPSRDRQLMSNVQAPPCPGEQDQMCLDLVQSENVAVNLSTNDSSARSAEKEPDSNSGQDGDSDEDESGEGPVSIFDSNMPGIMTREQVENDFDLDNVNIRVRSQTTKTEVSKP